MSGSFGRQSSILAGMVTAGADFGNCLPVLARFGFEAASRHPDT